MVSPTVRVVDSAPSREIKGREEIVVKASIGLEGRDVDASPTRASTGLSTRARFEPTAEDAEDAFHFDGAQSRSPFGRASDFPPSYDETKLIEAETSSGATGEDEEPALEQLRDELGFEVPTSLHARYEARGAERADLRNRQMECLDVYRNVPAKQRCVGGDACLALAVNGVHPKHRAEIWAEKLKAHLKQNSSTQSYYQYLELGNVSLTEEERELIDGDVRAVCPTHPSFYTPGMRGEASDDEMSTSSASHTFAHLAKNFQFDPQGSTIKDVPEILTNILIAAAERSPHGYCRGFVVPAAVMLLLTDDEEASFWMLAGLTEDVLSSFISRSAINLYSEAKYVDLEISLNEPELTAFLNKGECRPSVVVAGFLTRFGLGTLPTESVLRLWDALILEGGEILAPFSILVLKSVKDELMNTDPTTVCDSFDAAAANMFDIGDIIMDAIVSARDLSSKFDSLSIRLGEREVTADVLNNLNSFQAAVNSLSESAGPEGIGRMETISRQEVETVVREAYALDTFENVDTAVDKSYQMREMIMAHDLGTRHQTKGRKEGLRFDELMKVLRIKSSTSSKLKMLAVSGKTVEERVKNFIIGETNEEEPTEKSVKMALFVANGVLPTQRLSSAPLESSILMRFISSPNWYGEMRMDARSALILANFTVPLFMGGTMKDTFDVSIIATQAKTMDDSPRSFGGFVPLAHTQYLLLVQTSENKPIIVKKRFSNFKKLHETLRASGCHNIARVSEGILGTDAALSVDPHVVAVRAVSLQRYLDQLTSCGLPKVNRLIRNFLGLDERKSRASHLRTMCQTACSGVRCNFFGFGARVKP